MLTMQTSKDGQNDNRKEGSILLVDSKDVNSEKGPNVTIGEASKNVPVRSISE